MSFWDELLFEIGKPYGSLSRSDQHIVNVAVGYSLMFVGAFVFGCLIIGLLCACAGCIVDMAVVIYYRCRAALRSNAPRQQTTKTISIINKDIGSAPLIVTVSKDEEVNTEEARPVYPALN